MRAFLEDIGEHHHDVESLLHDQLPDGRALLWEAGGSPRALATRSRLAAGMVRIQQVYTPPELRGRGYAGAATAAATQAALDAGATEVVLNTDLANPTSNALYQRLGFEPVEDRTIVEFPA
jgi:predicted GNAT family acetyltransferase